MKFKKPELILFALAVSIFGMLGTDCMAGFSNKPFDRRSKSGTTTRTPLFGKKKAAQPKVSKVEFRETKAEPKKAAPREGKPRKRQWFSLFKRSKKTPENENVASQPNSSANVATVSSTLDFTSGERYPQTPDYHVVNEVKTLFFETSKDGSLVPRSTLPKGTVVKVERETNTWSDVTLTSGYRGTVFKNSIRQATKSDIYAYNHTRRRKRKAALASTKEKTSPVPEPYTSDVDINNLPQQQTFVAHNDSVVDWGYVSLVSEMEGMNNSLFPQNIN